MFFSIRTTEEGLYYFVLKSKDDNILMTSSIYHSITIAKNEIDDIKKEINDAMVFDNTDVR